MLLFLTPKESYKIPDLEHGDVLPAEGRLVHETPYWRRRIEDQDVTEDPAKAVELAKVLLAESEPKKPGKK